MIDPVGKEANIHGKEWHALHDGYFSDPSVAAPLIQEIRNAISTSKPDVIVDLGGGTGFLLTELIRNNIASGIDLVNLDVSPRQLEMASAKQIRTLHRSLTDFARADVAGADKRLLFIMRSVLHYHGRDGLTPLLQHLRNQVQTGEMFVHQTACFDAQHDADCISLLYEQMQTGKWYSTFDTIHQSLKETGWAAKSISPAPTLSLTSRDLGKRYGIGPVRMDEIRSDIAKRFGEKNDVFKLTADGFCAYLHYKVFVCVADKTR
jgi:SAM-dependent methyltransferase